MFLFGDPVDAARLKLNEQLSGLGPAVPDTHFEEMSEQDLRNLMAYLYGALASAIGEDLEDSIISVLREWYDEVFVVLAGSSDRFRENVLLGSVFPPGGQHERRKYLELAKEASES